MTEAQRRENSFILEMYGLKCARKAAVKGFLGIVGLNRDHRLRRENGELYRNRPNLPRSSSRCPSSRITCLPQSIASMKLQSDFLQTSKHSPLAAEQAQSERARFALTNRIHHRSDMHVNNYGYPEASKSNDGVTFVTALC